MELLKKVIFINMIGIYKIVSPKGKIYIGESIDILKRWNQYKNGHCQKQWKLERSIKKYGWDSHLLEVLEECEIFELKERERYYQLKYNSIVEGLNLKLTGIEDIKTLDSLEVKQNRSKGQLGRKQTEETKQKLSLIRKGVPKPIGFGDLMRKAKIRSKLSDSHKKSISKSKELNCSIDGIFYESCKKAALALNIPTRTLHNRLRSSKYPSCYFL